MFSTIIFAFLLFGPSAPAADLPCERSINPGSPAASIDDYLSRVNEAKDLVSGQMTAATSSVEQRQLRTIFEELSGWENQLRQLQAKAVEGADLSQPPAEFTREMRAAINDAVTITKLMYATRQPPMTLPYGNRARELKAFGPDWSMPPTSGEMGGRTYP